MIPQVNDSILYSYKSFIKEDLEFEGFKTIDELNKLDYISLEKYPKSSQGYDSFLTNYFQKYKTDTLGDRIFYKIFLLKEFLLKIRNDNIDGYYRFEVSDWNKEDNDNNKDTRHLTCDFYMIMNNQEHKLSFRVKVDHIYQLICDLRGYINTLTRELKEDVSFKDKLFGMNTYVLPLYLYIENINLNNKYKRISDIAPCINNYQIRNMLALIEEALRLFCSLNYSLVSTASSDEPTNIYCPDTNKMQHRTFKSFVKKATEDKTIVVDIAKIPFVEEKNNTLHAIISTQKNNIIVNQFPRKLCDYKYQVRGHWHKYWVGTGDDKHLEKRWIQPYYKNKDKDHKIVKEIKNGSN